MVYRLVVMSTAMVAVVGSRWWFSWSSSRGGGGCRGVVYGVVVAEKARGWVSGRHGGRTYRRDKDGTPFYPGFGQPEQEQFQHSESARLSALPYIYSYVGAWPWGHTQDEAKAKRYARSPLWSVSLGLLGETRPSP
ncbi:hypothetical protein Tco_1396054 [Tanacetum coccineum]